MKIKVFLIIVLLQICFLFYGIVDTNLILSTGESIVIKMSGFDPYDPIRGRYIQLALEENRVDIDNSFSREHSKTIGYVILTNNGKYDEFSYASTLEPSGEIKYIKCDMSISYDDVAYIYPKLDTYYVNEKIAPKLESIIRQADSEVFLHLKIKNGNYRIDKLEVNGEFY